MSEVLKQPVFEQSQFSSQLRKLADQVDAGELYVHKFHVDVYREAKGIDVKIKASCHPPKKEENPVIPSSGPPAGVSLDDWVKTLPILPGHILKGNK